MTTLLINQQAKFQIAAKGVDGTDRPAGFSATISNYAVAYVAIDGAGWLHAVPKTTGAVTVTITGHSQDGTEMTPLSLDFQINPLPVPQADHFEASAPVLDSLIIVPADPGTDTVTGNL